MRAGLLNFFLLLSKVLDHLFRRKREKHELRNSCRVLAILAGFEGAQDFSLAHSFEAIVVEGLGKTQGGSKINQLTNVDFDVTYLLQASSLLQAQGVR